MPLIVLERDLDAALRVRDRLVRPRAEQLHDLIEHAQLQPSRVLSLRDAPGVVVGRVRHVRALEQLATEGGRRLLQRPDACLAALSATGGDPPDAKHVHVDVAAVERDRLARGHEPLSSGIGDEQP